MSLSTCTAGSKTAISPRGTRGAGDYRSSWELLQRGKPNEPAFWPNGLPGPAQENGVNPVVSNETGFDNTKTYYFQSSLSLGLDIAAVEGWSVEGTVAYDRTFEDYKRWQKPWTLYNCAASCSGPDDLLATTEGVPDPRLTQEDLAEEDILLRATTLYEPNLGSSHNTTLLLGTEYQQSESNSLFLFRRFFLSDQITELFAGGTGEQNLSGNSEHARRLNFFGRLNYNYQQKLPGRARSPATTVRTSSLKMTALVSSLRSLWDGGSPQEDWFNDATRRLLRPIEASRMAYGQTGNDRIEPYQFLSDLRIRRQWIRVRRRPGAPDLADARAERDHYLGSGHTVRHRPAGAVSWTNGFRSN